VALLSSFPCCFKLKQHEKIVINVQVYDILFNMRSSEIGIMFHTFLAELFRRVLVYFSTDRCETFCDNACIAWRFYCM